MYINASKEEMRSKVLCWGVPWWSSLGFVTFSAAAQVQSMVGELRSGKLHGAGKKKKKKTVLGDLKAQRKNVETYACE